LCCAGCTTGSDSVILFCHPQCGKHFGCTGISWFQPGVYTIDAGVGKCKFYASIGRFGSVAVTPIGRCQPETKIGRIGLLVRPEATPTQQKAILLANDGPMAEVTFLELLKAHFKMVRFFLARKMEFLFVGQCFTGSRLPGNVLTLHVRQQ